MPHALIDREVIHEPPGQCLCSVSTVFAELDGLHPGSGYCFGRNALTTFSFVVRYGPSIRSMQ
jgi:hypothetical protein